MTIDKFIQGRLEPSNNLRILEFDLIQDFLLVNIVDMDELIAPLSLVFDA